jgi:hypothetical protein
LQNLDRAPVEIAQDFVLLLLGFVFRVDRAGFTVSDSQVFGRMVQRD